MGADIIYDVAGSFDAPEGDISLSFAPHYNDEGIPNITGVSYHALGKYFPTNNSIVLRIYDFDKSSPICSFAGHFDHETGGMLLDIVSAHETDLIVQEANTLGVEDFNWD